MLYKYFKPITLVVKTLIYNNTNKKKIEVDFGTI